MFLFAFLILQTGYSQGVSKLQKAAVEYFNNEEFAQALPLFLELDSLKPNNFEIKYYIGACYLNTDNEKVKGIPYLEFALEHESALIPKDAHKDLGMLYHLNYQFDKAIARFKRYEKLSDKHDTNKNFIDSIITVCNYAKEIVNDTLVVDIEKIPFPINTSASEQNPLITADESYVYFTRTNSKGKERIYYSIKQNGTWTEPSYVKIDKYLWNKSYSIAGLSPDGQEFFLSIGVGNDADIYEGRLLNGKCVDIVKLNNAINSNFWEGKASITPDGTTLYFSSNRLGGYGGKDIYKAYQNKDGEFSNPINLGPEVNTKYDEDAPFIHPDGQTLYFSSNGHKTIGGFDIYKTFYNYFKCSWSEPKNVGYPINSTTDDVNFVLSADGNTAYYSSNIGNEDGNSDIYKVTINKTIPLTLIKGVILGGDSLKPLKSRIRVVDKETNKRVKYVYNPNPETGKYLMIFPPNKNYNMIIEAEGYVPHVVNIHIPNQVYFYELFQEIKLSKIKLDNSGDVVGQEIIVSNTFYDIYNSKNSGIIYTDTLFHKDYTKLLNLIEELIETTDTVGLEKLDRLSQSIIDETDDINDTTVTKDYDSLIKLIEDAIETTDTLTLELLDKKTLYDNEISGKHFYGEDSDTTNYNIIVVDGDTIKTANPISTNKAIDIIDYDSKIDKNNNEISNNSKELDFRNSKIKDRKYITTVNIFFESNEFTVENKYSTKLEDIISLVKDNKRLGIEINGYSDTKGNKNKNYTLSHKRALSVLEKIVFRGVQTNRTVVTAYGESKFSKESSDAEKQNNRRVEIKIFELIK